MRYLVFLSLLGSLAAPALADWQHPVKWDQLQPDPNGFGGASWVNVADPGGICTTADDFFCTGAPDAQFITDIEFYGFSEYGNEYINQFRIQFWTDVPADVGETSRPGALLYSYDVPAANPDDPMKIGWQELEADHFKIDLPEDRWFDQGLAPRTLWLSIQGIMLDDGYADYFYWQFRDYAYHWSDDAAFSGDTAFPSYLPWWHWGINAGAPDLYDNLLPTGWTTVDMCFRLTATPEPTSLLLIALGTLLIRRR
jgi:hypothetical protein